MAPFAAEVLGQYRKTRNYVWDVDALDWVAMTQPGGSNGGGSDASAANQVTGNTSLASIDSKTPALGQALATASMPVVLTAAQLTTLTPPAAITGFALESTQLAEATLVGAVNETAPATDTTSSGLNGRLQRIAQRITSLIALVPTALSNGFFQVSLKETITVPVSGTFWQTTQPVSLATLPFATRADTFTTTTNGTTVDRSASPLSYFSVQVKGTGGAATTWDVRLEGSLDNVNFSQILQHQNTTGDGAVMFIGASAAPALYFRSRCAGLVLGAASNIVVTVLGA